MQPFFDNVYYRVCKKYKGTKDDSPEGAEVVVLSLMQCLNIFFIGGLFVQVFHLNVTLNKFTVVAFLILIIIINGIRYDKLNYDVLSERLKGEEQAVASMKANLATIYIFATILSVIFLLILRASAR